MKDLSDRYKPPASSSSPVLVNLLRKEQSSTVLPFLNQFSFTESNRLLGTLSENTKEQRVITTDPLHSNSMETLPLGYAGTTNKKTGKVTFYELGKPSSQSTAVVNLMAVSKKTRDLVSKVMEWFSDILEESTGRLLRMDGMMLFFVSYVLLVFSPMLDVKPASQMGMFPEHAPMKTDVTVGSPTNYSWRSSATVNMYEFSSLQKRTESNVFERQGEKWQLAVDFGGYADRDTYISLKCLSAPTKAMVEFVTPSWYNTETIDLRVFQFTSPTDEITVKILDKSSLMKLIKDDTLKVKINLKVAVTD